MEIILILTFVGYFILVILLMIGWHRGVRHKNESFQSQEELPSVSVIVPARNEARNIGLLLDDLSRQRYRRFNVIVVNDHSEDNTVDVVNEHRKKNPKVELLTSGGEGKKIALTYGINRSVNEFIVTTDADCRVPPEWLSHLLGAFVSDDVKMVFGAVKIEGVGLFARLQGIEFASVIGAGIAMAGWKRPIMCNGANLAFRRSLFSEVGGYDDNLHIPSGDDEFLMRKILKKYPDGVVQIVNSEAVVTTLPSRTVEEFVHQRIRWAGKWTAHQSIVSELIAIFIFCFQLTVLALPIAIWVGWVELSEAAILMLLKFCLELFYLQTVCRFLCITWSWRGFVMLQFFHSIYVVLVGVLSTFSSFAWKGRKLKSLSVSKT